MLSLKSSTRGAPLQESNTMSHLFLKILLVSNLALDQSRSFGIEDCLNGAGKEMGSTI